MQQGYGSYQDVYTQQRALVAKAAAGPARGSRLMLLLRQPDFLVMWLVPWAIFTLVTLFYTYGFMQLPSVCVLLTLFLLFAGAGMVLARRTARVLLPLGVTTVVAAVVGTLVGLYIYDRFACYPQFYANSRIYTNVVPSQPSAAVVDSGGVTFSQSSKLAISESVGYVTEDGYVYCIAPIRDNTSIPSVEFWAVGHDCCDGRGGFTCDEAEDPMARAGVRIFDNNGFFGDSNFDYYRKARKKAQAAFGLRSVDNPIYVRWVRAENLDMLSSHYRGKTAGSLAGVLVCYFLASGALAAAEYQPKR